MWGACNRSVVFGNTVGKDGCWGYMPSPNNLCTACGCHRNFHILLTDDGDFEEETMDIEQPSTQDYRSSSRNHSSDQSPNGPNRGKDQITCSNHSNTDKGSSEIMDINQPSDQSPNSSSRGKDERECVYHGTHETREDGSTELATLINLRRLVKQAYKLGVLADGKKRKRVNDTGENPNTSPKRVNENPNTSPKRVNENPNTSPKTENEDIPEKLRESLEWFVGESDYKLVKHNGAWCLWCGTCNLYVRSDAKKETLYGARRHFKTPKHVARKQSQST